MEECIVETLAYFDIFDYPLTFTEIKKYACCPIDITDDQLYDLLQSMTIIQELNGYYYFLGRSGIAAKRAERNQTSLRKLAKAKVIGKILSYIPTIEYIGISGSLSMHNAADSDDIDLFFITKKDTLWISRFVVNSVLFFIKQKRGRRQKYAKDMICPNMFMDASKVVFAKNRRTLYTAHELIQLTTLYNKTNTYEKLLSKNRWLYRFFPNISAPSVKKTRKKFSQSLGHAVLIPFERIFFALQMMYMSRHKTGESVGKNRAFFHPVDRQGIILDLFELRCSQYEKLHNDNLWIDRDEARFYIEEKKIRILN